MDHDVCVDRGGIACRLRVTCRTCNGATLVRQPYMTSEQWERRLERFSKEHPFTRATPLDASGKPVFDSRR